MSTNIQNGYKLKKKLTIDELQNFAMELRTSMRKTSICICERLVAERIADIVDTFMVQGKKELMDKYRENRINLSDTILSEAYWDLWKEHTNYKKGKESSDPDGNFDCSVVFFPIKRKILALFLYHHNEYRKAWEEFELVQQYEYYDSVERPKGMTSEKWKRREKQWNQALQGIGVSALSGMEVKCVIHMPIGNELRQEEIIKYIPSYEKRARNQAEDILFKQKISELNKKENDNDNYLRNIMKVERWLRSEEGRMEIQKECIHIRRIIKPTIEQHDLHQTIESYAVKQIHNPM